MPGLYWPLRPHIYAGRCAATVTAVIAFHVLSQGTLEYFRFFDARIIRLLYDDFACSTLMRLL